MAIHTSQVTKHKTEREVKIDGSMSASDALAGAAAEATLLEAAGYAVKHVFYNRNIPWDKDRPTTYNVWLTGEKDT